MFENRTKFILKVKRIFHKVYKIIIAVLKWVTILPILIEYISKIINSKGEM